MQGSNAARGSAPDDAFIDMLMRCQGSRLEEQRSELPRPGVTFDAEQGEPPNNNRRNCVNHNTVAANAGATVPDEDFFSLIMRVQGGRMEDQRAAVSRNAASLIDRVVDAVLNSVSGAIQIEPYQ